MNANTVSACRQARLTIATLAVRAAAMSACLLAGACASLQPTHTGFLNDYESLRPNTAQPSEGAFRKSGLDLGHYRAFMIKWHLGNVANLHAAQETVELLQALRPVRVRLVLVPNFNPLLELVDRRNLGERLEL